MYGLCAGLLFSVRYVYSSQLLVRVALDGRWLFYIRLQLWLLAQQPFTVD